MLKKICATAVIVATPSLAIAGGIDRSGQSIDVIFKEGRHLEFSFGSVNPNVSGVGAGDAPSLITPTPGQDSGDMAPAYMLPSIAYKADLNENVSYAVIYDTPFGADVAYPAFPASSYYAQGANADLNSTALTALAQYNMGGFSVFGGVRAQSMGGEVAIPFVSNYSAIAEEAWGLGYVAGAAYEKPEIAMRVALSFNSEITHDIATTETSDDLGADRESTTTVTTPKSINLSAQSGIAENTLLFGSIRWVEWSSFDISPDDYGTLTSGGSLVSYDNDTITYSLGIGRRLNENLSVSASIGFEEAQGGFSSNLGPTDGNRSIGIAAVYTKGNTTISGGIRYIDIGDAQTTLDPSETVAAADFTGNSGIAVGIKVELAL